ncbi:sensor histidine kinase [Frondihabitans sp. PAMC 28766]|uniref:sensor histidine kinase n=1 Tax=Frondihabitans sp. PAMC 28766 TaxID=1795630 RepID=UPI000A8575DC|nr:histidine kinase [Frondihabitans sp. PAMC 28766]
MSSSTASNRAPSEDDLLLPRPPGVVRRYWMRHARFADVLIAIAGLILVYPESIDTGLGLQGADWLDHGWLILAVLSAAVLVFRRTRPLATLGVQIVLGAVLAAVAGTSLVATTLLGVYAVAVYSRPLYAWIGSALAYGGMWLGAGISGHFPDANSVFLVGLVIVLLFGSNIGNRRRYLQALIGRAAQLARERDQQGLLATAAERARIAREMHDVVAHSLSVVVRLSDGAEAVAESDPARSREAVRQIGEVGRESLRDMRRLLGVLRDGEGDDSPELGPQPTLAELDHLVETYRATGLPVAVQQSGTPPTDAGVQVAVYRAVQESLTNALRYSREPNRVLVQLDYTRGVAIEVTDDGLNLGPMASVGTGRGLVGLRERAAVFGGTVEAGPRIDPTTGQDGGGWRVRVILPPAREDHR